MSETKFDIEANRKSVKYSKKELVLRILWGLIKPLFKYSPRTFFSWRIFLLRLFGARIGSNVHIYNSAYIYLPWKLTIGDFSAIGEWALIYNLGQVNIGRHVILSQRTHLCAGTHDYTERTLPLKTSPISIEDQAWICADAFIGPYVIVGEGAVVGARAVATKNIEPWTVVAGNPAKFIKRRVIKVQ